jgi:hypothetical protein
MALALIGTLLLLGGMLALLLGRRTRRGTVC